MELWKISIVKQAIIIYVGLQPTLKRAELDLSTRSLKQIFYERANTAKSLYSRCSRFF